MLLHFTCDVSHGSHELVPETTCRVMVPLLSRLPSRCCLLSQTPLTRGPLCLEVPGAPPFSWFKLRLQHCSVLFPCSLRVIDLCFLVVPAIVTCMAARELELRQAQIRVALRTLTQSLRACRKQAQSEERCPAGVWRALEAMLLLSKGDFECARVFLSKSRRR